MKINKTVDIMDVNPPIDEYIIDLNYDCWECIFSKMDWNSWLNFCKTFPGFKRMDHEIQRTMLILTSLHQPSRDLINIFHRVKRATIMADLSNDFLRTSKKYLKLTALEQLIVTYINKPIDFISSTKLKKLIVSPFLRAPCMDFVEHVLKISHEIKSFKYFNGSLNDNSLSYMTNNPIEELYFYDTHIDNEISFINYLANNMNLTKISILGWNNTIIQNCFFSIENESLTRITYLKFSIQANFLDQYRTLRRCVNLETIVIKHKYYQHAEKIYSFIFNLPKLKKVEVFSDGNCLSPDNALLDLISFDKYQTQFMNRNVIFREYTYPLFNEKINRIRI